MICRHPRLLPNSHPQHSPLGPGLGMKGDLVVLCNVWCVRWSEWRIFLPLVHSQVCKIQHNAKSPWPGTFYPVRLLNMNNRHNLSLLGAGLTSESVQPLFRDSVYWAPLIQNTTREPCVFHHSSSRSLVIHRRGRYPLPSIVLIGDSKDFAWEIYST